MNYFVIYYTACRKIKMNYFRPIPAFLPDYRVKHKNFKGLRSSMTDRMMRCFLARPPSSAHKYSPASMMLTLLMSRFDDAFCTLNRDESIHLLGDDACMQRLQHTFTRYNRSITPYYSYLYSPRCQQFTDAQDKHRKNKTVI